MNEDELLRSRLAATPDDVPSFEAALLGVHRRVQRRRRRRRIATVAASLMLVLGVGVPLIWLNPLGQGTHRADQTTVRNGPIAYTRFLGSGEWIYTINPDGSGDTRLSGRHAIDSAPAWSPDGTRIAFMSFRPPVEGTGSSIYVMDADGGNVRLVAQKGFAPAWSPDGTRIAFSREHRAGADIFVVNADGSGLAQVTRGPGRDVSPTWSPDGRSIAFVEGSNGSGFGQLQVMNAAGTDVRTLLGNRMIADPKWSPNGDRIVFESPTGANPDGSTDLFTVSPAGTDLRSLTDDQARDLSPAWSPDGTKIAFSSDRDGRRAIFFMNADGSNVTRVTSGRGAAADPSWGPATAPSSRPASTSTPSIVPASWVRHEASGVSIATPASWSFTSDPVPGLVEPNMLFAVGTGAVPAGGSCAPSAAIDAMPLNGALFFIEEYAHVSQPYTLAPRPARLTLGPLYGPFECLGVKAHDVSFEDGGRYFQVFVMFGPDASASLRSEVEISLDTLVVRPLPASQQPSARCRQGVWIACPEAAWVYEVMNAAGVFHLGQIDETAIRALADGRSFAITTHPEPPVGSAAGSCRAIESIRVCRTPAGLIWRVHDLTLEIVPAPSTSATLKSRPALPTDRTLRKLVVASERIPLPPSFGS